MMPAINENLAYFVQSANIINALERRRERELDRPCTPARSALVDAIDYQLDGELVWVMEATDFAGITA